RFKRLRGSVECRCRRRPRRARCGVHSCRASRGATNTMVFAMQNVRPTPRTAFGRLHRSNVETSSIRWCSGYCLGTHLGAQYCTASMSKPPLTDKPRAAWITWIVAVSLVLGTALRLYGLTAMEFKGDEQEMLTFGIQLLEARPLT